MALPSGTVLASYPVIVFDASEEASAEDGGASVDMSELTVETPKLPKRFPVLFPKNSLHRRWRRLTSL